MSSRSKSKKSSSSLSSLSKSINQMRRRRRSHYHETGLYDILRWAREKDFGRIRYHCSPHKYRSDKSIENEKISILEVDERGRRAIHWCCVHVAPFDVFLYLLNHGGLEALTKDNGGMTPLHLLCLYRAPLTFITQIIEKGNERDVWEENNKNMSPLDLACRARAPYDVICYLMELRGEIVTLFKAISEKNWKKAEQYITDPLNSSLLSHSPFHSVSKLRRGSVLKLKSYFPDSNFLHWACMFGAPISIFKLLLDKGINPNEKDEKGRTPLHLACYKKLNSDIVDIFIEVSGNCLLDEDDEGLTPLIAAFIFNEKKQNSKVINRLLTAVELRTKYDFSQLYNYVLDEDWEKVRKHLSDEDVSEIEKRTSVCFRDISSKKADRNPLHWACRYSAPKDIIYLLIKYGNKYSVSYADDGHRTPFHIACQRNAPLEVIEAFVQVFATTESHIFTFMDKGGLTPLANACVSGASEEIVEYLLESGGLEDSIRLKHNKRDNLLDTLLCKPTPAHIIEFIQQKWIEIDPLMTTIPNRTVEKSLEWIRRKSRDTGYCFKGKFIRTILNEHFIRKSGLSILMIDGYIQLILVIVLSMYRSSSKIPTSWKVLLVICEIWISFRELLQLFTTPFKYYVLDFWNYVDLIQISFIGVFIKEAFSKHNGDHDIFISLIASGFVWLSLIGVLKTMSYRIGIFVNAFIQILYEIIPFIVVTMLLLMAFATMFNDANQTSNSASQSNFPQPTSSVCVEDDNFFKQSTLGKWVLKSVAMLMTDGWFPIFEIGDTDKLNTTSQILSIIFGFIIGILIINVLIAKISNVFSEVDAKGRNVFWEDRLSFLSECTKIRECFKYLLHIGNTSDGLSDKHTERFSILSENDIDVKSTRYDFNPLNSSRFSEKELSFNNSKEGSQRFDFSMASTKEIKKMTTISERDQFFHWWMQPDLWDCPSLKTRLTFFIKRERFSEILVPGQTFERILSGNKDNTFYFLTYLFGILLLPCFLFIFILGLPSLGYLWPKPLKEYIFFGTNEHLQELTNEDLLKKITVLEDKMKLVDDEVVEVKESLKKVSYMLSEILREQDNPSEIFFDSFC